MKRSTDFIIVGGGIVGASVAYGLLKAGCGVTLLDGGPEDPRASVANFGLVWVQGKGPHLPAYQTLTRDASDLWPRFAEELLDITSIPNGSLAPELAYERKGGLTFCLSDEEFEQRQRYLHGLHNQSGGLSQDCEMLDRKMIEELLPDFNLGPDVVGGSYCWRDGCINPLNLYTLLLTAIRRLGGKIINNSKVEEIERVGTIWKLQTRQGVMDVDNLVLSAGLDNERLAKQVGFNVPIQPQRGQILVSERRQKTMRLPASTLRQTADGTFLVGATKEDVGLDMSDTPQAAKDLASRVMRIHPDLADMKVVRQWGGLRIITPDGAPIYEFGDSVSAISCHSGITLSPVHAEHFVDHILKNNVSCSLKKFTSARFDNSGGGMAETAVDKAAS